MKKIFLIIIILLLQSFPSFGNPNGKGLVCKCIVCPKKYTKKISTYYLFENNKVKEFKIFEFNEKSSIEEIDYKIFHLFKDKIYWTNFTNWSFYKDLNTDFTLNRKNLSLKIELLIIDQKDYSTEKGEVIRQCEVLNKNDFQIKLNKEISNFQKIIDKNLDKENKI
jgi:hypothetical protein